MKNLLILLLAMMSMLLIPVAAFCDNVHDVLAKKGSWNYMSRVADSYFRIATRLRILFP
jgi:uncharacterized membrane protein YciS (DUF1049 family)